MTKPKKIKQEVTDVNFDMGNLTNATQNLSSNKKIVEKKTLFYFRISAEYKKKFFILKNKRAENLDYFEENNTKAFYVMVLFVKDVLEKKGIYRESPIFFKNIVSKVGKRTKNSRTVPKEERKEIQIFLTDFYNDMYINCFYSFVANDSNLDVNDVFYSRTYFFVDFLDLILKNEKLFLNFNPNLN